MGKNASIEVDNSEYISLRFEAQKAKVKVLEIELASCLDNIRRGNLTPESEREYKQKLIMLRSEWNKEKEELKIREAEILTL